MQQLHKNATVLTKNQFKKINVVINRLTLHKCNFIEFLKNNCTILK